MWSFKERIVSMVPIPSGGRQSFYEAFAVKPRNLSLLNCSSLFPLQRHCLAAHRDWSPLCCRWSVATV
jgi:hypothetical protein